MPLYFICNVEIRSFKLFKICKLTTIGNGCNAIDCVSLLIGAYERRDTSYKPFEMMWPFYGRKREIQNCANNNLICTPTTGNWQTSSLGFGKYLYRLFIIHEWYVSKTS